jgi:hypothetical protein
LRSHDSEMNASRRTVTLYVFILEATLTVCVEIETHQERDRMSAAVSRTRVMGLYRSLLKEAFQMKHYNMREYALRSVRTRFRENMWQRESTH